eukprot:6018099-Amphidinium_carterae.2
MYHPTTLPLSNTSLMQWPRELSPSKLSTQQVLSPTERAQRWRQWKTPLWVKVIKSQCQL